jgi:four helix bundle protein
MSKISSFEDMEVWQRSKTLAHIIFELTQKPEFSKDFALKDQINRAMGSVMDNIAGGFERQGNREFTHFLYISKGAAGEVRSQLHRARDRKYIEEENFNKLSQEISEVSKQLGGFINYLKQSELEGTKFVRERETIYYNFES